MKELLIMALDPKFRSLVRDECLKEEDGDYDVTIRKLIELTRNNPVHKSSAQNLESLVSKLSTLKKGETPIIFYPRVEIYDDYRQKYEASRLPPEDQQIPPGTYTPPGIPTAVFQNNYYADYSTDGYIINTTTNYLEYFANINEDYAWDNDVWVIGYGENCSAGNMTDSPLPPPPDGARYQGQPEYGMSIQCTNLNAIEPWLFGKLEFKYTVLNSSGAIILGPITSGRTKRKYFKNQQWYSYNKFIGNWNTSTFGNWMYENWIEEDGGNSSSVSLTLPPPQGSSGPTTTVTIPSQNQDDTLGTVTIQFTDQITQIYNISYANVKRKN